ncbi:LOW QUALITY PROTEIN: hypothetical protein IFM47457_00875 [Aspergillus lentulus]|nr:LOW QUALITY PROTEIN: hypothetical protein IFM47457_00875 [Aspergillus lentulus]
MTTDISLTGMTPTTSVQGYYPLWATKTINYFDWFKYYRSHHITMIVGPLLLSNPIIAGQTLRINDGILQ